jgi:hypothetical protein
MTASHTAGSNRQICNTDRLQKLRSDAPARARPADESNSQMHGARAVQNEMTDAKWPMLGEETRCCKHTVDLLLVHLTQCGLSSPNRMRRIPDDYQLYLLGNDPQ